MRLPFSLRPSTSRWGIITVIITVSVPLFILGVSAMWQLNPTSAAVFVGLGSAGLLVVIGLIVYWIVTESKDPTATDLSDIKKTLGETKRR